MTEAERREEYDFVRASVHGPRGLVAEVAAKERTLAERRKLRDEGLAWLAEHDANREANPPSPG